MPKNIDHLENERGYYAAKTYIPRDLNAWVETLAARSNI